MDKQSGVKRSSRRSSILKRKSPSREVLGEIQDPALPEDDAENGKPRRRVSFATTVQLKQFIRDHGSHHDQLAQFSAENKENTATRNEPDIHPATIDPLSLKQLLTAPLQTTRSEPVDSVLPVSFGDVIEVPLPDSSSSSSEATVSNSRFDQAQSLMLAGELSIAQREPGSLHQLNRTSYDLDEMDITSVAKPQLTSVLDNEAPNEHVGPFVNDENMRPNELPAGEPLNQDDTAMDFTCQVGVPPSVRQEGINIILPSGPDGSVQIQVPGTTNLMDASAFLSSLKSGHQPGKDTEIHREATSEKLAESAYFHYGSKRNDTLQMSVDMSMTVPVKAVNQNATKCSRIDHSRNYSHTNSLTTLDRTEEVINTDCNQEIIDDTAGHKNFIPNQHSSLTQRGGIVQDCANINSIDSLDHQADGMDMSLTKVVSLRKETCANNSCVSKMDAPNGNVTVHDCNDMELTTGFGSQVDRGSQDVTDDSIAVTAGSSLACLAASKHGAASCHDPATSATCSQTHLFCPPISVPHKPEGFSVSEMGAGHYKGEVVIHSQQASKEVRLSDCSIICQPKLSTRDPDSATKDTSDMMFGERTETLSLDGPLAASTQIIKLPGLLPPAAQLPPIPGRGKVASSAKGNKLPHVSDIQALKSVRQVASGRYVHAPETTPASSDNGQPTAPTGSASATQASRHMTAVGQDTSLWTTTWSTGTGSEKQVGTSKTPIEHKVLSKTSQVESPRRESPKRAAPDIPSEPDFASSLTAKEYPEPKEHIETLHTLGPQCKKQKICTSGEQSIMCELNPSLLGADAAAVINGLNMDGVKWLDCTLPTDSWLNSLEGQASFSDVYASVTDCEAKNKSTAAKILSCGDEISIPKSDAGHAAPLSGGHEAIRASAPLNCCASKMSEFVRSSVVSHLPQSPVNVAACLPGCNVPIEMEADTENVARLIQSASVCEQAPHLDASRAERSLSPLLHHTMEAAPTPTKELTLTDTKIGHLVNPTQEPRRESAGELPQGTPSISSGMHENIADTRGNFALGRSRAIEERSEQGAHKFSRSNATVCQPHTSAQLPASKDIDMIQKGPPGPSENRNVCAAPARHPLWRFMNYDLSPPGASKSNASSLATVRLPDEVRKYWRLDYTTNKSDNAVTFTTLHSALRLEFTLQLPDQKNIGEGTVRNLGAAVFKRDFPVQAVTCTDRLVGSAENVLPWIRMSVAYLYYRLDAKEIHQRCMKSSRILRALSELGPCVEEAVQFEGDLRSNYYTPGLNLRLQKTPRKERQFVLNVTYSHTRNATSKTSVGQFRLLFPLGLFSSSEDSGFGIEWKSVSIRDSDVCERLTEKLCSSAKSEQCLTLGLWLKALRNTFKSSVPK